MWKPEQKVGNAIEHIGDYLQVLCDSALAPEKIPFYG